MDGGRYAADAIEQGAWGAVVATPHVADAVVAAEQRGVHVFEAADPLAALTGLARAWLQRLRGAGCRVVGITGSTGKTSTKDILNAMLAPALRGRVHASRENFNTEIGLPLTVLEANVGVRVLVLEMAMRGMGQIRELAQIAQPGGGRHHEHRARAPRAGGHGRARGGGEGGADRRAAWHACGLCGPGG